MPSVSIVVACSNAGIRRGNDRAVGGLAKKRRPSSVHFFGDGEMAKKTNMYKLSVKQWNPFVGCKHDCIYCKSSFKRQLKRWAKGKGNCLECAEFIDHEHSERLDQKLPNTGYMQFIFVIANGDVAFCKTPYLKKIVGRIREERNKTFLIQSKNPKTFSRINFPKNTILGITVETNRDELCEAISKAPKPSKRYKDFLEVKHPLKMVTIEPVMKFDINVMINWIENINPCMVWLGYDSGKNHLLEPKLEKVKNLYWELGCRGFTVILKKIRKVWWEELDSADQTLTTQSEHNPVISSVAVNRAKDNVLFADSNKPEIKEVNL